MIDDIKLTEHFSLYELTDTSLTKFLEENRRVTDWQIGVLTHTAKLAEAVRDILGVPLKVTSGYRCPALNKAEGSTDRSQHLKCEAFDSIPIGLEIGNAFRILWRAVRDGNLQVGQLIYETSPRSYGAVSWIHASLGEPWRLKEKCNQVLRMQDGVYTLFQETKL